MPGVGKTHLMAAIAWAIEQEHPETRIKYSSASEFVRDEFRLGPAADDFWLKKRYECVDLLLLENPEELGQMVRTRQRLYSFLQWYLSNGKTLVLTCASSPMQMAGPRDALSSWFELGLKAELHPLDRKGRAMLLKNWVGEINMRHPPSISDAGIQFLADRDVRDMRELSGLLARVLMEARLTKRTISAEQIRALLAASSFP
jgi:chromosomal replication initiator protein